MIAVDQQGCPPRAVIASALATLLTASAAEQWLDNLGAEWASMEGLERLAAALGFTFHHEDDETLLVLDSRHPDEPLHPPYVAEGYWHPDTKGGQVHDHPERPGRGWSITSHRLCEPVYTNRALNP